MKDTALGFRAELYLSPKPVLALLVGLAVLVTLTIESLPSAGHPDRAIALQLLLFATPVAGWMVADWRPAVGRWFVVLSFPLLVGIASAWLPLPEALPWAAMAVAVAAAMLGPSGALIVAGFATALVAAALWLLGEPANWLIGIVAFSSIWAVLAVMLAVYRPVFLRTAWLEEYYAQAQEFIAATQTRRAELERTLESLAQANRQLALAEERSASLRRVAEEAERAKAMFVANVSHELRTPLNMIMGLVELMVDSPEIYAVSLPAKMREDLQVVYRNCEHLSGMVNDVLDLTRIESGRMILHRERVDLRGVVIRAAEVVRPLLDKKALALNLSIPAELPEVYCDRVRVQQVILNLLSNAARFTEAGSTMLTVTVLGQDVQISVADTGPGIAPEDAARIFEPFVQGSGEMWRAHGGSGLGLSISRRFIDMHGGRMWLESQVGQGTTFFFTLPVAPPMEPAGQPGGWIRSDWVWREQAFLSASGVVARDAGRPRVIIADPEDVLANEFARESDRVDLIALPQLEQAVQEAARTAAHALIVNERFATDLQATVRAASRMIPGTPIVGCAIPRPMARALEAGAHGYLIKPVRRSDVQQALNSIGRPVRRVLVADDDPDGRDLLRRMLQSCEPGLDVVEAANGFEAVVEVEQRRPDLLLLDIVMPDLDGWQVLRRVRERYPADELPVIFISAQDPSDGPLASPVLVATTERGIPMHKLLPCALAFADQMLKPEAEAGPAFE